MPEQPFTIEIAFNKLEDLIKELEKICPDPAKGRIIDIEKEYTPQELRDLLQKFGSYLSSLHTIEAKIEAQCHAIKEGLKTGISLSVSQMENKATIKDREANLLASNESLRELKRMQIYYESYLTLVQGWRQAYHSAYSTISRLITLMLGEIQIETSGRFN